MGQDSDDSQSKKKHHRTVRKPPAPQRLLTANSNQKLTRTGTVWKNTSLLMTPNTTRRSLLQQFLKQKLLKTCRPPNVL